MKMKTKVLPIVAAGALMLGLASCDCKKSASLKTDVDSVSYAIGAQVGIGYRQQIEMTPDFEPNIDDMIAGFANALKGDTTMTQEQTYQIIQSYFMKLEQQTAEKTKAEGEKFLEENAKKEGVITTESGLQYKIDSVGTGDLPGEQDIVTVNYEGRLIDGEVFDSSIERGTPAEFNVNSVIPGWTEALKMMPVGSKWTLYIPSELAYGSRQAGPKIKPNSVLVFNVELLSTRPSEEKK
jgi:FKBP-type peptidyl-prolyl cis-trans isomerase